MVMTSGSTYVIGGAFGPKSRGGVVIVLDGSAGFPAGGACARTTRGASTVVPALTPTAPRNVLREMPLPFAMSILLERRDGRTVRAGVQQTRAARRSLHGPCRTSREPHSPWGRMPHSSRLWPCSRGGFCSRNQGFVKG